MKNLSSVATVARRWTTSTTLLCGRIGQGGFSGSLGNSVLHSMLLFDRASFCWQIREQVRFAKRDFKWKSDQSLARGVLPLPAWFRSR
ncbi:MAG: hypothetical protein NXI32_16895, partial [bacterium]|nr:hypothetical protein [bacterium]